MAGIQLQGNFGHFNVLTCVMALPLLHHSAALRVADVTSAVAGAAGDPLTAAAVAFLLSRRAAAVGRWP